MCIEIRSPSQSYLILIYQRSQAVESNAQPDSKPEEIKETPQEAAESKPVEQTAETTEVKEVPNNAKENVSLYSGTVFLLCTRKTNFSQCFVVNCTDILRLKLLAKFGLIMIRIYKVF